MGCAGSCPSQCGASDAPVGARWQARALSGKARYVTSFERDGVAPPAFSVARPADPDRVMWLPDGHAVAWPDSGLSFHATAETPLEGGLRPPPGTAAAAADGLRVKIYVVAGPREGSCRHLDQSACNLYEIDWPIPAGTPPAALGTYIRRLVADPVSRPGVAKPDVHHTRPVVAFSHVDPAKPAFTQNARLGVVDLVSGLERPWTTVAPLGHASAWGDGDTIWYNRDYVPVPSDPRYQALWSGEVLGMGTPGAPLSFSGARQWFLPGDPGPEAGYCSFGWPATNSVRPELMGIQTVWGDPYDPATMVTLGVQSCPFFDAELGVRQNTGIVEFPAIGVVMDVVAAEGKIAVNPWVLGVSWWQVGFVRGPQHRPAVDQPHGAAHADWSPDGTTLLYFEQEGQTFATGQELARTFGFVFDGTQYASVRLDGGDPDVPLPIYDHPDAASLPLPASASAADCVHYLHKYARFCGAPGDAREGAGLGATVIVVSVACEDEGASFVRPSFFNRVYLVDFSDAASPIYEDLTSWIEQFEDPSGALYGTFGGTQADCSRWYVSVGGGPLPPEVVWPDPPAHDPVTPIEGAGPSLDDFDDLVEGYPPTYAVAGVVGGPLHKPGVFP